MDKEYFGWHEFDLAVAGLALEIKRSKRHLEGVFGIPRGGWVVAVALGHLLGLPLLKHWEIPNETTLVVDDISDSGFTLEPFKLVAATIATIHVVKGTKVVPDFFAKYRDGNWVVYPWEYEPVQL